MNMSDEPKKCWVIFNTAGDKAAWVEETVVEPSFEQMSRVVVENLTKIEVTQKGLVFTKSSQQALVNFGVIPIVIRAPGDMGAELSKLWDLKHIIEPSKRILHD